MKKILEIARWEYVEKIRTKAFLISIIVTPIIIILFSIIPALFFGNQYDSTKIIGILDETNLNFSDLNQELSQYTLNNNQPAYILINLNMGEHSFIENKTDADKKINSDIIYGYFLVSKSGSDHLTFEFRSKNMSEMQDKDIGRFEIAFNNLSIKQQLKANNINPGIIDFNKSKVLIKQTQINDAKKNNADYINVFYRSIIFIILLTMIIIYSGQTLVRSLLEEKSNRLIEILISSCKPEELLSGKILGLSALGFTQMVLWFFIGSILLGSGIIPLTSLSNLPEIIIYFILGFIFYSSLLVGIGSVVSTEQEAQQITSYLSMILIIPIVIILPAMQNPESIFVKILTYFPLTLPSIMILKLNLLNISVLELITTVLIMLISILLTIKVSSKIFRVGILYYDKMPSLKELKNWIFLK
ncbi:MAG: ABC transporter permease [Ignavibacteriaceae bacterium]